MQSMEDWNTINKECLNAPVRIKRIVEMTCALGILDFLENKIMYGAEMPKFPFARVKLPEIFGKKTKGKPIFNLLFNCYFKDTEYFYSTIQGMVYRSRFAQEFFEYFVGKMIIL